MIKDKEHYDLIKQFDKEYRGNRLDKETKDLWSKGCIYQDGEINNLFLAYRKGYSLRKSIYN